MKVFCVDDDVEILNLLRSFFQMRGHEVEVADSAFGLSRRLSEARPDVLLLDHRMPGLSGENFLAVFQHTPQARHTGVIYYSAEDRTKLEAAAAKAGVLGWIPKSVVGLELVRQVEELAARRPETM